MILHQVRYNLLDRRAETEGWLGAAAESGAGTIVFSPLAQGVLTDRYLKGVPAGSRASRNAFLRADSLTPALLARVARLDAFARERGQTLAAMSLAWILRRPETTSVIVGASRPEQLLASLDQSLRRLGLEYVDVFYHHRPDPDTPLEESRSPPPGRAGPSPERRDPFAALFRFR